MKIIPATVKHIDLGNNVSQIGYAASICYNSNKQGTVEWLEQLWKAGHRSPFRHGTSYYVINTPLISEEIKYLFCYSPYCGYYEDVKNKVIFVSVNSQFKRENDWMRVLAKYQVTKLNFLTLANDYDCREEVVKLIRLTFEVVTQISTSRELNRISPNNICEQSTRYCNFSKDKYNGNVSFVEPHWLAALVDSDTDEEYPYLVVNKKDGKIVCECENSIFFYGVNRDNKEKPFGAWGIPQDDGSALCYCTADEWVHTCLDSEERYLDAIKKGMKPEDARGMLPLDTATKCIYTYRVEEWLHFLDLRLYGKTGKPHPNAKVIAKQIERIIYQYFPDVITNHKNKLK